MTDLNDGMRQTSESLSETSWRSATQRGGQGLQMKSPGSKSINRKIYTMLNKFSFAQKLICLLGVVSVIILVGVGGTSYLLIKKHTIQTINQI